MGILDDAIREHLELKRKHGVPEDELQRQEEEALGPARREVAQQPEEAEPAAAQTATAEAGEPDAPAANQETVLFDMEEDAGADAELTANEAHAVRSEPDAPDAVLGDTEPHGFDAIEEEEPGEEPAAEDERELDDDELLSAEEEAAAEEGDPDVLEDTPDFLQETPEHDRLWFEQKPPRDFDFD